MTKQEQIEEMAQIICGRSKDDICIIDKTSCDSSCRWARDAEAIYNAGYRKLPEDSIVLSREEYEKLQETISDLKYDKFDLKNEISEKDNKIALLEETIDCIKCNVGFTL